MAQGTYRSNTAKNMSHLSTERLAALADDAASGAELAHLATCELCARERSAFVRLLELSRAEQRRIGVPLSSFDRLVAAGIAARPAPSILDRLRGRAAHYAMRAASVLLLIGGGVVIGRYSAKGTNAPGTTPVAAATSAADSAAPVFSNVNEARAARAKYEMLYQNAAAYLAQHDTGGVPAESPAAMRTRLAALDRVDRVVREAMNSAPYDPVINGYYLTTIGQREQTLRQLNTALPVGLRIDSY